MQSDGSSKVTTVLMSKAEAEAVTQKIVNAGNTMMLHVLDAFEREAWKALGYKSWTVYVEDRFTFTRQHSYELMRQGRITRALPSGARPASASEAREVVRRIGQSLDDADAVREVVGDIRAPLKDKKPKRGMRDTAGAFAGISAAVEFLEARVDGVDDEDVVAYLTLDQRRAAERAVTKASEFAERWGELLSRPIQRRETDEWASA